MIIWLYGNLSEGFVAYGPYASWEDCFEAHDGDEGWGMELRGVAQWL